MATAREQVEAYAFAARRQVLALLQGEDNVVVDPRRRLNRSTIGGLLLTVAIVAVVGIAGFLVGGSSSSLPKQGVIIDSANGGSYVLVNNVLHPTLNLASARLIAGSQQTTVSDSTLRSVKRGLPVGIPDAPDQLPPDGNLIRDPWTVCSVAPQASAARPRITVSIGATVPSSIEPDAGLTVRTPDNQLWLLANGQRFLVTTPALTLLALDRVPAVPVLSQVLALVPQGPTLAVPTPVGTGSAPSVRLPFTASVGDLLQVARPSAEPARYVVLSSGIAPIGSFAAALLAGDGGRTVQVSAGQLAQVPSVQPSSAVPSAWPRTLELADPLRAQQPLCLTYDASAPPTDGAWSVRISEPRRVPLAPGATAVAASSGGLPTVATGVAVPPGRGVLVRATGSGGTDGTYALVLDSGLRYPLPTLGVAARLGYASKDVLSVPLPFVDLLPSGPALDPSLAVREYAGSDDSPGGTSAAPVTGSGSPD